VFVRFLKLIGTAVPDGLELHLICDNYATRKTPAIKKWLLPPVPPALPPDQLVADQPRRAGFAELTNRKLRRSAHRSVTDWSRHPQVDQRLVQRPRPYVWTKTADEILDTCAPLLAGKFL
jgi:hypothetical protein